MDYILDRLIIFESSNDSQVSYFCLYHTVLIVYVSLSLAILKHNLNNIRGNLYR